MALLCTLSVPGSVFKVSCGLCVCCFVAHASKSLAGGFLVAVAGRALFAVWLFLKETSVIVVLSFGFTFSPAQWALLQLNGPVFFFLLAGQLVHVTWSCWFIIG